MSRPIARGHNGRNRSAGKRIGGRTLAQVLRKIALAMLPFYRMAAGSRKFNAVWSRAVRKADLSAMEKLLRSVAPATARRAGLSVNGIGYFVEFPFPRPVDVYVNSTSLQPGTAQFHFRPRVHRSIAAAILPLYRKLACNRKYAEAVGNAIRSGSARKLDALIRSTVPTPYLKSIRIDSAGFRLGFQFPGDRFVYYNQFFRFNHF